MRFYLGSIKEHTELYDKIYNGFFVQKVNGLFKDC